MVSDDTQQAVFAFLADPATHGGSAVKRIDTHAAVVFLAGERALKIKRAVRFPFLDYSTLDKRRAACEAELAVNRAFAPDIYRGVLAIRRTTGGRLALGGEAEPVEWAVEMRRFDEEATFDRLADNKGIDLATASALAHVVATAHAKAPVAEAAPWIAALATYLDQNAAAFAEAPKLFPADAAKTLDCKTRAALTRVTPLLVKRGRRGLIRRGHGDLHLGNVALIDGRPVPFDAIEFDPLIATGDVLYDLAFLLMDLTERRLDAAANVVLNRYLAETRRDEDFDALAALPLFISLRAAIRAKVTAAKMANVDPSERAGAAKAASTYFGLAVASMAPPPPQLVAVGGLSGTGKSVLARMLAPKLAPAPGAVILRSDVERKSLFGVAETDRLPADAYTADVTARVYATLSAKARRVVAAGHSAVIDAVFARADERDLIASTAKASAVPFHGLFLSADLDTRLARVGARTRDASDADTKVALAQESYAIGALDWAEVDASGSPDDTLAHAETTLAG